MRSSVSIGITIVIGIAFILVLFPATSAEQSASVESGFKYGIIWKSASASEEFFKLDESAEIGSGCYVKVNYQLIKGKHIYLIWLTPGGEYVFLNPHLEGLDIEGKCAEGKIVTTGWLKLDKETGIETVYMLASTTELSELKAVLDEYYSDETVDRKMVSQKITAELAKLQAGFTSHREGATLPKRADKPTESGAVFRGDDTANKILDFEVSGDDVAFASVKINHR